MSSEKLISTQSTAKALAQVNAAITERFGKRGGQAIFEHGQWWVVRRNGAQYSVVDAEPGIGATGLDFEEVSGPVEE